MTPFQISTQALHWAYLYSVDAVILDGAVIVNMLKPGTASTFSDYASHIFVSYITRRLEQVHGVDVVWDEYVHDSLKT